MSTRADENRCLTCRNDYSSRRVLVHHLLMVHGQWLPFASRRPVDLNPEDLRRRLELTRDAQRSAYTLPQDSRRAQSAAEGQPRDWDQLGPEGDRRRGLWARMGPSPTRGEDLHHQPAQGAFPDTWAPGPHLASRSAQARAPMPTTTVRPTLLVDTTPLDFSGNVIPPTERRLAIK